MLVDKIVLVPLALQAAGEGANTQATEVASRGKGAELRFAEGSRWQRADNSSSASSVFLLSQPVCRSLLSPELR
jgi:hypothetical protein